MDFLIKFNDSIDSGDRAEWISDLMLAPVRMAFGRLFEDFQEEKVSLKWRVFGLITIGLLLPLVLVLTILGIVINHFSKTYAEKSLYNEKLQNRDFNLNLIEP